MLHDGCCMPWPIFLKCGGNLSFWYSSDEGRKQRGSKTKRPYYYGRDSHNQIWNLRTRNSSAFCNESDKGEIRRNL